MRTNGFGEEINVDEMKLKLSTKFIKNFVTKMMTKTIYKKYGYKIDIQLNELEVEIVNGTARLHTNVDISTDNNELINIIKSIGED